MKQSQANISCRRCFIHSVLLSILLVATTFNVKGQFLITKTADLNFGTFYCVSGACSVTISPLGVRTKTGNVVFLDQSAVYSAAQFIVSDITDRTYSINALPASISLSGPGTSMIADTFVSNPTVATGGTLTGGTQTINVGATINLSGPQASGIYTSIFSITVEHP